MSINDTLIASAISHSKNRSPANKAYAPLESNENSRLNDNKFGTKSVYGLNAKFSELFFFLPTVAGLGFFVAGLPIERLKPKKNLICFFF